MTSKKKLWVKLLQLPIFICFKLLPALCGCLRFPCQQQPLPVIEVFTCPPPTHTNNRRCDC